VSLALAFNPGFEGSLPASTHMCATPSTPRYGVSLLQISLSLSLSLSVSPSHPSPYNPSTPDNPPLTINPPLIPSPQAQGSWS
jgi:hypothetical protein